MICLFLQLTCHLRKEGGFWEESSMAQMDTGTKRISVSTIWIQCLFLKIKNMRKSSEEKASNTLPLGTHQGILYFIVKHYQIPWQHTEFSSTVWWNQHQNVIHKAYLASRRRNSGLHTCVHSCLCINTHTHMNWHTQTHKHARTTKSSSRNCFQLSSNAIITWKNVRAILSPSKWQFSSNYLHSKEETASQKPLIS